MGTCLTCGTTLTIAGIGRPQSKFCSRQCKDAQREAIRRAELIERRTGRVCIQCGAQMPATLSTKAKCCSKACSVTWQNEKRAEAKRVRKIATRQPCLTCGAEIPIELKAGALYCCLTCKHSAAGARWRERSPGYMRQYLYGLSQERYDELMAKQGNACAICRSTEWPGKDNRPHVDHDHTTGAVRGLLCGPCNTGLGQFGDDHARLRAAIEYLENHL